MAQNMGLGTLGGQDTNFKRKFRWLFTIDGVADDGAKLLPPSAAARPSMSFREQEFQHVTEVIYLPTKPEWKTINLKLYEPRCNQFHPVFSWLQKTYDPAVATNTTMWHAPVGNLIKPNAFIKLFDGPGNVIEQWTLEAVWPQNVDFGELDMASSEVVTCDVTLRYARAYISG